MRAILASSSLETAYSPGAGSTIQGETDLRITTMSNKTLTRFERLADAGVAGLMLVLGLTLAGATALVGV